VRVWVGAVCLLLTTGCGPGLNTIDPDIYTRVYALSYDSGQTADFLLTNNPGERSQLLGQSWQDSAGSFQILTAASDGNSVALYRCHSSSGHFFSGDANCEGATMDYILGYMEKAANSTTPESLRRCLWTSSTSTSSEYLDVVGGACPIGSTDQGILGYVSPVTSSGNQSAPPELPSMLATVYQLYSETTGDYLLTLNPSEITDGTYQFEGVAFTLLTTPADNSMFPLYRCSSQGGLYHFVSTDANCEGETTQAQYGYAYSNRGANHTGATALYRFHNPEEPSIHITTTISVGAAANWILESFQGYGYDSTISALPPPAISFLGYASGQETVAVNVQNQNSYAYGPSIMLAPGGGYYLWTCTGLSGTGDSIVFSSSPDGINWSSPTYAIHSFNNYPAASGTFLPHACDPSAIVFTPVAGGPSYYYIFFSMYHTTYGTVNGVSRSSTPGGPYAIFTGGDPTNSNNWSTDVGPEDPPYIITYPTKACHAAQNCYGAGQPSVVLQNGTLHMWYTDTTGSFNGNGIYYTTSTDGINWTTAQATNVANASIDVKYDPQTNQYVMLAFNNGQGPAPTLSILFSTDGLNWVAQTVARNTIPAYGNNPGMAGDPSGFLSSYEALIGFGAPYDISASSPYQYVCPQGQNTNCGTMWNLWIAPLFIGRN